MEQMTYYECGNGWLSLIKEAEELVNQYNKDNNNNNQEIPIEFTQIKEKWGYLNLYLNIYPLELHKKLLDISKRSMNICENCGTSENVKTEWTHGWVMTLCDKCRQKELEQFYELKEKLNNKLYNNENNR